MLVYFSAENFRSIKAPVELDLRAAPKLRRLSKHVRTPTDDKKLKVLKSAVMYGANASGKSNIIKAISFAQDMITKHNTPNKAINFDHFALTETPQLESSFYFEFVVGEVHFGFGVKFNKERILAETLSVMSGDKEHCAYSREYIEGEDYQIDSALFEEEDIEEEDISVEQRQEFEFLIKYTAKNRLFMSECAEKDVFTKLGKITSPIAIASVYFHDCLIVVFPESTFAGLMERFTDDSQAGGDLISTLSGFDTGLSKIEAVAVDIKRFPGDLLERLQDDLDAGESVPFKYDGIKYQVELTADGELKVYQLHSIHSLPTGKEISFELENESDGTLRLLDLLPAVVSPCDKVFNQTFIIDEFDRSLHPNLAKSFIDLFLNSSHASGNNQLIVSTHQAELLDNDLLRRDEIWFVQKEWDSSTKLYSLNDYNTRFDKDIHRAYLAGKFGAVPMIMDEFRKA